MIFTNFMDREPNTLFVWIRLHVLDMHLKVIADDKLVQTWSYFREWSHEH